MKAHKPTQATPVLEQSSNESALSQLADYGVDIWDSSNDFLRQLFNGDESKSFPGGDGVAMDAYAFPGGGGVEMDSHTFPGGDGVEMDSYELLGDGASVLGATTQSADRWNYRSPKGGEAYLDPYHPKYPGKYASGRKYEAGYHQSDTQKIATAEYNHKAWEANSSSWRYGKDMPGKQVGHKAEVIGYQDKKTYWDDLLEVEGHIGKAEGEISFGDDGAFLKAGAELFGASAKLGGAEHDQYLGTELAVGAGCYSTPGVTLGLHWSDDDKDGIRELGGQFGFGLGWGVGAGGDISIKTEAIGHMIEFAKNAPGDAWDWLQSF